MSDETAATSPDHAVPDAATEAEPKGLPTSDRHHSETASHEKGGAPEAPKHTHTP